MRKIIYKTKETYGGLYPITKDAGQILINSLYFFFDYDEEEGAKRYQLINLEKNIGLPTWIYRYEIQEDLEN